MDCSSSSALSSESDTYECPRSEFISSTDICTPNWSRAESPRAAGPVATVKWSDEEIRRIHHQLEVIEHRIQSGHDAQHVHPAEAIGLLDAPLKMTRAERAMGDRYEIQNPTAEIPAFWEPRVYDRNQERMADFQTKPETAVKKMTKSSKVPPVRKLILRLSTMYFDTDRSDDETDLESF
jgi:hypothetical protein